MRGVVRWVVGLRSVVSAILIASGLSIAGLFVVRRLIPMAVLRASNDVVGNYLQTLGGIYAVLLAFVVYVVWGQFNEARALVDREANEVLDLYRTVEALEPAERCAVREGLRAYVDAVLDGEWDAMACGRLEAGNPVGRILDGVWDALQRFEPGTRREAALFNEALKRFNDLSDARSDRLTSAQSRIPGALHLLLYGGAALVVGSMWLFALDNPWMHAFLTSAMAGAVSHVLYVIRDLDDAFTGDWRVDPERLIKVRAYMRRHASGAAAAPTPDAATPTRDAG